MKVGSHPLSMITRNNSPLLRPESLKSLTDSQLVQEARLQMRSPYAQSACLSDIGVLLSEKNCNPRLAGDCIERGFLYGAEKTPDRLLALGNVKSQLWDDAVINENSLIAGFKTADIKLYQSAVHSFKQGEKLGDQRAINKLASLYMQKEANPVAAFVFAKKLLERNPHDEKAYNVIANLAGHHRVVSVPSRYGAMSISAFSPNPKYALLSSGQRKEIADYMIQRYHDSENSERNRIGQDIKKFMEVDTELRPAYEQALAK